MLMLFSQPLRGQLKLGCCGISASEQRVSQLHCFIRSSTALNNSKLLQNNTITKHQQINADLKEQTCTDQLVNKSHPNTHTRPPPWLGTAPSFEILWRKPPVANLGVSTLLVVQLLHSRNGASSFLIQPSIENGKLLELTNTHQRKIPYFLHYTPAHKSCTDAPTHAAVDSSSSFLWLVFDFSGELRRAERDLTIVWWGLHF